MTTPEYDAKTLRAVFGKPMKPSVPIASDEIAAAARRLAGKLSISGVQPKLSMTLDGDRLIPVARDGRFILKPQTQEFAELPQNEDLCMSMAERFGLRVAPHLLLSLADGAPAYVVRRFDRIRKGRRIIKLACEDMHQILGGRDKYAGSHERIGAAIGAHTTFPPLELQRFFELVIFNFAVGNGDSHRKNFSLLTDDRNVTALSPAYDLVSSRLAIPEEREELALTTRGKHSNLNRADFLALAEHLHITPEYAARRLDDLVNQRDEFHGMIESSTLTTNRRQQLAAILDERLDRLR